MPSAELANRFLSLAASKRVSRLASDSARGLERKANGPTTKSVFD